jgi:hypothetical protein
MLLRHVLLLLVNFVSLQNATNTNQNPTHKQLGSILYENKARKGKTSCFDSFIIIFRIFKVHD